MSPPAKTFQELILRLQNFWSHEHGCVLGQPFDVEKGAGTYNPHTFLRALGPEPWNVAYVEPSRRPTDGRYGENPNRLYRHHQFQVILKPNPPDVQRIYLDSMAAIGIHPDDHDIRFVEDNWASPTLGAWGLGWEVWVDGMELTQFTYFQQVGQQDCKPVCAELTYGLERIAMYLQQVDNVYDLRYAPDVAYREVFHQDEVQYSRFALEELSAEMYQQRYDANERECERLVELKLVIPAYDHLLSAAHAFNSLDARGAISVTERQRYIGRIKDLATSCASSWLELRESLGFPLCYEQTEDISTDAVEGIDADPRGAAHDGEIVVEVGTEELPAGEVMPAVQSLADSIVAGVDALGVKMGTPALYATPRRLAVIIPGVPDRQEDRTVEHEGPPVTVQEVAVRKFAEKHGLTPDQLKKKETKKGEKYVAVVEEKGRATAHLLSQIIRDAIAKIPFKKRMRWGDEAETFCRPIQWIVARFDGRTVPLEYAGVSSDRLSRGHRFLAPSPFVVESGEQYVAELAKRHVVPDPVRRRAMIVEGAQALAKQSGGKLLEDEALLDEITQLVEFPVPLLGSFDERFLEIPKEVLISEMQHHQRYLPIVGEDGQLRPNFVVVANTKVKDDAVSLGGYRRVLTARFQDGHFFFEQDQKTPLIDRVEALGGVRFHRDLGSILDKVDRLTELAFFLSAHLRLVPLQAIERDSAEARTTHGAPEAELLADYYGTLAYDRPHPKGVEQDRSAVRAELRALAAREGHGSPIWQLARAGRLVKADLTTSMVFEFPDLQGVMGAHYARRAGEPAEVADAIEQHYLPRGADDDLPEGELGALLGVADRLDSITGIFTVGKGPSGSADPFALRRAAIGIISILRARDWHLSLREAVGFASRSLEDKRKKKDGPTVIAEVLAFFRTRLKGVATSEGIPTDVAESVLTAGYDDVIDALARGQALAELKKSPDFEPVAVTFKRATNILRQAEEKGFDVAADVSSASEDSARALLDKVTQVEGTVRQSVEGRKFDDAFAAIADLRPVVAAYFDDVMVMAEDPAVRANNLGLVKRVVDLFEPLADFTKLS